MYRAPEAVEAVPARRVAILSPEQMTRDTRLLQRQRRPHRPDELLALVAVLTKAHGLRGLKFIESGTPGSNAARRRRHGHEDRPAPARPRLGNPDDANSYAHALPENDAQAAQLIGSLFSETPSEQARQEGALGRGLRRLRPGLCPSPRCVQIVSHEGGAMRSEKKTGQRIAS